MEQQARARLAVIERLRQEQTTGARLPYDIELTAVEVDVRDP